MTAMLTATFGTLVPTLMRLVALEPSLSPALMYADIQRLHAISAVLRMRDQLSWDDHELARRLHADDTSSLVGAVLAGDMDTLLHAFGRLEAGAMSARFYQRLAWLLSGPAKGFVLSQKEIDWQVLAFASNLVWLGEPLVFKVIQPGDRDRTSIAHVVTLLRFLRAMDALDGDDEALAEELSGAGDFGSFALRRLQALGQLPPPPFTVPGMRHVKTVADFHVMLGQYKPPAAAILPMHMTLALLRGDYACFEAHALEEPLLVFLRRNPFGIWSLTGCYGLGGSSVEAEASDEVVALLCDAGVQSAPTDLGEAFNAIFGEVLAEDFMGMGEYSEDHPDRARSDQ